MIEAKQTYNKPPKSNKSQKSIKFEGFDDDDIYEDAYELDLPSNYDKYTELRSKPKMLRDVRQRIKNEQEKDEPEDIYIDDEYEDLILKNPKYNNNDNFINEIEIEYNHYIKEFQNVFNADYEKSEKIELFNQILNRASVEEYTALKNKNLSSSDIEKIKDGYNDVEQVFNDNIFLLEDGEPLYDNEFYDIEERDDVEKIVYEELKTPQNILFENIEYKPRKIIEDNYVYDVPIPIIDPPLYKNNFIQFNGEDEKLVYDTEEFKDYSKTDYFYTDSEYIEDAVFDFLNEPDEKAPVKKSKSKKKLPLNLKIYQEFVKISLRQDPDRTKADINEEWRENKDFIIDTLIDEVEKSGGNMYDEEHYINMFNNIAGFIISGGNLSLFNGIDNYNEKSRPTNDNLSDPQNWINTISNISESVYDTVSDISDFLDPTSWF